MRRAAKEEMTEPPSSEGRGFLEKHAQIQLCCKIFLAPCTVEQQPHGSGFPVLPSHFRWLGPAPLSPGEPVVCQSDGRFHRCYSYPVARNGDTLGALIRSALRHRHGLHADQVDERIAVQVLSADRFYRRTAYLLRYHTSIAELMFKCVKVVLFYMTCQELQAAFHPRP